MIRTVGVALATHNGMTYVGEQLASIHAQTRPVERIVAADDGSTDGTYEFLLNHASQHPNVRVVRASPPLTSSVQGRIGANFRQAASYLLACDAVVFADQDDQWAPTKVEEQVKRLERPGCLMTCSDALIIDEDSELTGQRLWQALGVSSFASLGPEELLLALLGRPACTGACAAIGSELMGLIHELPPDWLHDRWLSLLAASRGGLDMDPSALTRYRVHSLQNVGLAESNGGAARKIKAYREMPASALRKFIAMRALGRSATPELRRHFGTASLIGALVRKTGDAVSGEVGT